MRSRQLTLHLAPLVQILTGSALAVLAAILLAAACDSSPARHGADNPLDPENGSTGGDPYGLTAAYEGSTVSLRWARLAVPGLAGYTIFRKSEFEDAFARIDTAEAVDTRWDDPSPVRFAESTYRIAAIGADGSEADTTGRETAAVVAPPLLTIAEGAAATAAREVLLAIEATEADRMIVSEDTLFAGAAWEAFDTAKVWTLSEGKGTKRVYLRVARGEADTSEVAADSIATAATNGTLVLARGETVTARARVSARLSGDLLSSIELSEDGTFGEAADTTLAFDSLTTIDSLDIDWVFDTGPSTKRLRARFRNEFGSDTTAVDSILPDLLEDVEVLLAGGDTAASVCDVSLSIDARAVLMNLSPTLDFAPGNWTPFRSETTWTIGDTAGVYDVWVQLSNDFVNLMESPVGDSVRFLPIRLAVAIASPSDGAYAAEGDTLAVSGSVVAASCREAPDTAYVLIADSLYVVSVGDTGWSVDWVVDEDPSDTTSVRIVASATDEADSTASDTIDVFVVPAE